MILLCCAIATKNPYCGGGGAAPDAMMAVASAFTLAMREQDVK